MAFAWVYFSPMMSNLNLSLPPAILATMVLIWLLLYCLLKPLGPTTSTNSVLAVSFCSMATKLSLLSPVISSLLGSLGSTPTETLRQSRSSRTSRAKRQRCFRVLVMCVIGLLLGTRLKVVRRRTHCIRGALGTRKTENRSESAFPLRGGVPNPDRTIIAGGHQRAAILGVKGQPPNRGAA